MWEIIEAQARETSFQAVVVIGSAFLVGTAAWTGVWAWNQLLKLFGLYSDFTAFQRRRRR
jgi:hypothetical protein